MPQALRNLATVYLRTDRPAAAEAFYRRALTLAPGDLDARENLAMAVSAQGREDDARDILADTLRRAEERNDTDRARRLRQRLAPPASGP